jgi:epoxyqueuosine reductase
MSSTQQNNPDSVQGAGAARLNLDRARALAVAARFDEAGLVALPHEETLRDARRFEKWIEAGRAGSMHYLTRTQDEGQLVRANVATPFPWARSAIVCFAVYNTAQPRSIEPAASDAGWIARYAWSSRIDAQGERRPSDYHKVLLKRLRKLEESLREDLGPFESRAYVDTGPVVERSLATAAGLGWTGKNTCLIHPKLGSFGFLAVLLTSLDVEADRRLRVLAPDRCGTCTRCLEACPTDALITPYQMDATRCISYLTIEQKGPITPELMAGMGRQVFGCDICQDVCPWNRKAAITADPELETRTELVNPSLDWLAEMDERQFDQTFNGSPVRRAGFAGMQRNVAVAMANAGLQRFVPRLREWAGATDEGLRAAARWALRKLDASGL